MHPEVIEIEAAQQAVIELYRKLHEELLAKVYGYYREELVLRGDKILNREYCKYFGIEG